MPNLEYFKQKNETDIRGKIRWELENLAKPLLVKELLERREHGQDDYEIIARNLKEEVTRLVC